VKFLLKQRRAQYAVSLDSSSFRCVPYARMDGNKSALANNITLGKYDYLVMEQDFLQPKLYFERRSSVLGSPVELCCPLCGDFFASASLSLPHFLGCHFHLRMPFLSRYGSRVGDSAQTRLLLGLSVRSSFLSGRLFDPVDLHVTGRIGSLLVHRSLRLVSGERH
jgi:hypothetical protein